MFYIVLIAVLVGVFLLLTARDFISDKGVSWTQGDAKRFRAVRNFLIVVIAVATFVAVFSTKKNGSFPDFGTRTPTHHATQQEVDAAHAEIARLQAEQDAKFQKYLAERAAKDKNAQ